MTLVDMSAEEQERLYGTQFGQGKDWDIKLAHGRFWERQMGRILAGLHIEVKTERKQWIDYSNIAIEAWDRGKPSGLSVTQAEEWAHVLLDDAGERLCTILIPVERLKWICRNRGVLKHKAGEDGAAKVFVLPTNVRKWL